MYLIIMVYAYTDTGCKGSICRTRQCTSEVASRIIIKSRHTVTYKAGDQPKNALSLNVLEPGEWPPLPATTV